MARHKQQLIRVCLIDSAIRSLHYPTKGQIMKHICEGMSLPLDGISAASVEKDIFYMRMELDAPIVYSKLFRGYHYKENYNFIYAFLRYWSGYMIIPPEINAIIYSDEEE